MLRLLLITICLIKFLTTSSIPFHDPIWLSQRVKYNDQINKRSDVDGNSEWMVMIDGDEMIARQVADSSGYLYGGPIFGFEGYYIFYGTNHSINRRNGNSRKLTDHKQVKWAEIQTKKSREKRYQLVDDEVFQLRMKRVQPLLMNDELDMNRINNFNDELWDMEWYLEDNYLNNRFAHDLNVGPLYKLGINGTGIRVLVLDDGIEHTHHDLRENYDPDISCDLIDRDNDPTPIYDGLKNSHGTRCAGEIAMKANNELCGVGIAYGATVGGVRMLFGDKYSYDTDRIEGEALGWSWDKVDIYSASWGPNDNGATLDGPGVLATEAIKRGISKGRNGKGSIYVWANGNGGLFSDDCNCDGFASNIWTISIGGVNKDGTFPWYGEVCTSTMASTYSADDKGADKIVTTDLYGRCTLSHTGTSAAAPLAAGVIALVLQANPNLTWRDVQHLIAWTSKVEPILFNSGWIVNGAGFSYSPKFGFGLLDATTLVKLALSWQNVGEQIICNIPIYISAFNTWFNSSKDCVVEVNLTPQCVINSLEHVELLVSIKSTRRGSIAITLISPAGTKANVLKTRTNDTSLAGFRKWGLISLATWGENPHGVWKIIIRNGMNNGDIGHVESLDLNFYGTEEPPVYRFEVL